MKKYSRGVSLVEVMIGVTIILLILLAIGATLTLTKQAGTQALRSTQATYLAEDGYELVRLLRDTDWNSVAALPVDVPHQFEISGGALNVTTGTSTTHGIFTRTMTFRSAYRDSNDALVASTTSGAVIDSGTRLVEIVVSWDTDKSTRIDSIVTNLHDL
jgi:Tfp pilus assembly protein PilV